MNGIYGASSTAYHALEYQRIVHERMRQYQERQEKWMTSLWEEMVRSRYWQDWLTYENCLRRSRWYSRWYYQLARFWQKRFPEWVAL